MIYMYNVLFILILGFLMKNKLNDSKWKKRYLFIVFFQMALIQGLRGINVGTDTHLYVNTYDNYLTNSYYYFQYIHFEPIFRLIYTICHFLKFNSSHMLLLVSLITMFGFAFFINKNSKNVVLSVFLFACLLYPNSFNILRQYLALSISINAYPLIFEKKYFRGIFLIVFSYFIHSTSLLLLLLIPLRYIKKTKTRVLLLIILLPITYFFGENFVFLGLNILGKTFYVSRYMADRLFRMTTGVTILFYLLSELFVHICKNENDNEKQELIFLSNICALNVLFGILYLKLEYFSRIIELFNTFLIISIPLGVKNSSCINLIVKVFIYLCPFLLMLNAIFNSGSGIEHYNFIFS